MPDPTQTVSIHAGSRLHFGMLAFGDPGARQFGGVGVMIDRPAWQLSISAAASLSAAGHQAGRVKEFARRWATARRVPLPACAIAVTSGAPAHVGLGAGTQLAIAVAAALDAFHGFPPADAATLAAVTGRARRSAVGTYGFLQGGLIHEPGRLADEPIAPLGRRVALPAAWRFVLARPVRREGLSGRLEDVAFGDLPPVPRKTSQLLARIIEDRILPAAAEGAFQRFADSVHEYGRFAGLCFAARQGGAYNGPELAALVDLLCGMGARGVGQSSWGPTIFALANNAEEAADLAARLAKQRPAGSLAIEVAAARNEPACISVSRDLA